MNNREATTIRILLIIIMIMEQFTWCSGVVCYTNATQVQKCIAVFTIKYPITIYI